MKRVLVAGGGITGLSLAYFLSKEPDLAVTLVESSDRLGGVIRTEEQDGFLLESGPDSFLSEKTAGVELAVELGLENELLPTRERYRKACVARGGRLHDIPKGFYLMAPSDAGAFLKSPVLSWGGKFRVLAEPLVPRRRAAGDESVGSFIRRRFGSELLERIGQPMVAGVYTGDPEELSLQATFPKFLDWEARDGSVVRGLVREREKSQPARGPRYGLFVSFRRGMETLVRALASKIPAGSVRRARIERLERNAAGGWKAAMQDGSFLEADAVCAATGSSAASGFLRDLDPGLSRQLAAIRHESVATVQLAFGPGAFTREPSAAGFVVPAVENRSIVAATFADLKFDGRAPAGGHLVRAFVGGAFGRAHFEKTDPEMVRSALQDLRELAGTRAEPLFTRVWRLPAAMVQYSVGHLERTAEIEKAAAAHPGLYLAGAPYRGVGIPDCIAQAKKTAGQISYYLKGQR